MFDFLLPIQHNEADKIGPHVNRLRDEGLHITSVEIPDRLLMAHPGLIEHLQKDYFLNVDAYVRMFHSPKEGKSNWETEAAEMTFVGATGGWLDILAWNRGAPEIEGTDFWWQSLTREVSQHYGTYKGAYLASMLRKCRYVKVDHVSGQSGLPDDYLPNQLVALSAFIDAVGISSEQIIVNGDTVTAAKAADALDMSVQAESFGGHWNETDGVEDGTPLDFNFELAQIIGHFDTTILLDLFRKPGEFRQAKTWAELRGKKRKTLIGVGRARLYDGEPELFTLGPGQGGRPVVPVEQWPELDMSQ